MSLNFKEREIQCEPDAGGGVRTGSRKGVWEDGNTRLVSRNLFL